MTNPNWQFIADELFEEIEEITSIVEQCHDCLGYSSYDEEKLAEILYRYEKAKETEQAKARIHISMNKI